MKASDPVVGGAATPIKKAGGQEMVAASMVKMKKKRTEIKVGKKVGRLVEKGKEVKDKNRMKTGTVGVEEEMMVDEEVGKMVDQDGGDGGAMVGQGRRLNRDQPSREKGDEVMEYPCPNCYNMFPSVEILTNHFKNCYLINPEFKASHEMDELKGGVSRKGVLDGKAGEEVTNVKTNPFDCGTCGKVVQINTRTILETIICFVGVPLHGRAEVAPTGLPQGQVPLSPVWKDLLLSGRSKDPQQQVLQRGH